MRGYSGSDEAPPVGIVVMSVRVTGPKTVEVKWTGPSTPNGQLNYTVHFSGLFYVSPDEWNYNTHGELRFIFESQQRHLVSNRQPTPYSNYRIHIVASNSKGPLTSNQELATLPKRTIFGNPTIATTFLKTGLEPFVDYEFRLIASNGYGQTQTDWVSLHTRQDKPVIDPPTTGMIASRFIDVSWSAPLKPNGVMTHYLLKENNALRETAAGNVTSVRADGLTPNTRYVFRVEACTVAGCKTSPESQPVRTFTSGCQRVYYCCDVTVDARQPRCFHC